MRTTKHKPDSKIPVDASLITHALTDVLQKEANALTHLIKNMPPKAFHLVEMILATKGAIVFLGIGKSGHVAHKLAGTFSSLGIPASFLHPSEALHGDCGMLRGNDLVIMLSKSGTGTEYEQLLPYLQSQKIMTILLSCRESFLASRVNEALVLPFQQEACDLNLAPTSSSTVMMAFGDALAIVASRLKGFGKKDFARLHPAGALGKRLTLKVRSLMYATHLPLISSKMLFHDALVIMTEKKLGVGIVVDDQQKLLGIVTDGDLRRAIKRGPEVFQVSAESIMTINPKTITSDQLAYEALQVMEEYAITSLVVTHDERVVGLLHIHDVIKAGISLT